MRSKGEGAMVTVKQMVPKLRFPEFVDSGAWTRKRLSELLFETRQRNRALGYGPQEVLSVSGEYGCVNQIEFKGRSYAGVSVKDYHVVETGDIVYTKSPLKNSPFGIIKENKGPPGIVSTLYAVYRVTELGHPAYLDHYFSRDYNLNSYLQPLVKKGAKNDMKVNNAHVLSGEIPAPKAKEQQKIADCLSSLDTSIGAETRKIDSLKAHKRGLMQQLFPAEGRFLPSLRFLGFKEEWRFVSLSRLASRSTLRNSDKQENRVLTNSAEHGVVDQRDYFDKDIADKGNLQSYYVVKKGDYVYNPRVSNAAPVGPISKNGVGTGVMSPLYTVFRFQLADNAFFAHFFKSSRWHGFLRTNSSTGARHDRMSIGTDVFMQMPVPDIDTAEQKRIVDCLSSLDDVIAAQSRKVAALRRHRKGLMQGLFPTMNPDVA